MIPMPIDIDLSSIGDMYNDLSIDLGDDVHISPLTVAKQVIKNRKSKKSSIGSTSGEQLKNDLGLKDYPYVIIQKIINGPVPMFIVTYDSRRPKIYLSPTRVRKADTTQVRRIRKNGTSLLMKGFKITPPVEIGKSSPIVGSGSIVIVRDLAGEYYKSPKRPIMNESIEKEFTLIDYNLTEETNLEMNFDLNILLKESVIKPDLILDEFKKEFYRNKNNILSSSSSIDSLIITLNGIFSNSQKIVFYNSNKKEVDKSSYIAFFDGKNDMNIQILLYQNCNNYCIANFDEFYNDIEHMLGHELIHRMQFIASEGKNIIKSKLVSKRTISNSKELMCYAWETIQLYKYQGLSNVEILDILKKNDIESFKGNAYMFILNFYLAENKKVMNQLYKYMFQYLEK